MNEERLIELASRIDRLQRDNNVLRRRMRSFILVVGAMAIVVVASGALLQNIGRFEKAVEVTDRNNKLRSVLFADDNNGKSGFEIRDPNSNVRLAVHTNQNDDPFLEFFDTNLKKRIELGIGPNGDAYLLLRRGDGTLIHRLVAEN